jgi:TolB protein
MKTYLIRLIVILVCSVGFHSTALAREIVITTPGKQAIPLALTHVLPYDTKHFEVEKTVDDVLSADLDLSGLFELVDPAAFLDDARQIGVTSTQVNFPQWRLLGAQVLIKGAYRISGGQVELDLRLYDVISRRLLAGHNYRGQLSDLRRMAHSFADLIMKTLTGKGGAFNTRIAFVSDKSGHKELYLMESDGFDAKRITNHRSIVLNPDFSPLGREVIFTSYRQGNPDLFRKEIYTGREARISRQKGLNVSIVA